MTRYLELREQLMDLAQEIFDTNQVKSPTMADRLLREASEALGIESRRADEAEVALGKLQLDIDLGGGEPRSAGLPTSSPAPDHSITRDCWCKPTVQFIHENGDVATVVIHNDGESQDSGGES